MTALRIAMLVVAAAIVLLFAMLYYFTGHQAPPRQPPLTDLASTSLDSLRRDFNRKPEQVRVILLLSPT
jgi:hypothetical protein